METPFKQQRKNKVWIPRTTDETERMNTVTRAIKQSQEAGCHLKWNTDGELKNVKLVYPRAESGGGSAHWLLRLCGDIICIYSLGRGRGRLVDIRWYSGMEPLPPSTVQNILLLLAQHLPPTVQPSQSSCHSKDPDPVRESGKLPLSAGTGGSHQLHSKGTKPVHAVVGCLGGKRKAVLEHWWN